MIKLKLLKYEHRIEPSIEAEKFDIKKFNDDPKYYHMIKFDPITGKVICLFDGSEIKDGDYIVRDLGEDRYFEYYVMENEEFNKTFRRVHEWQSNLQ